MPTTLPGLLRNGKLSAPREDVRAALWSRRGQQGVRKGSSSVLAGLHALSVRRFRTHAASSVVHWASQGEGLHNGCWPKAL